MSQRGNERDGWRLQKDVWKRARIFLTSASNNVCSEDWCCCIAKLDVGRSPTLIFYEHEMVKRRLWNAATKGLMPSLDH